MSKRSQALEFLEQAKADPKLSTHIRKIFEKHGQAQAAEIRKIARRAGYTFSQSQFQKTVKGKIANKFSAGPSKHGGSAPVHSMKRKPIKQAPESACSRGCLSWSHNWCP